MKKKIITITILIIALALVVTSLLSCAKKSKKDGLSKDEPTSPEKPAISHYTCPMHPQIHEDKPGDCPICHMRLVPVYQEGAEPSEMPTGGPSVTISPQRQQLIGLKTTTVSKKEVSRELRTVGRVAFDPDLMVAQREYLEISKNVPSLKEAARSNLRLKGMSEEEIKDLEKSTTTKGAMNRAPTSLYLPGPKDSIWVYATLYPGEMDLVKSGTEAIITLPSGGDSWKGTVRAVDPVVDPMTRSVRARIEIPPTKEPDRSPLRPDTFVNVSFQIDLGEALTIPKSAVIDTGTRKIAFVVHENRHFQARELKTGPEVGDDIVIREGLEEGEMVVSSATFLIDSESQLKAAVTGMEHQH